MDRFVPLSKKSKKEQNDMRNGSYFRNEISCCFSLYEGGGSRNGNTDKDKKMKN